MKSAAFVLSAFLVLLPAAAPAAPDAEAEPSAKAVDDSFEMTDGLQELLDETDEDGKPVLDDKARKAFEALPVHARRLFAEAVEGEYISLGSQVRDILSLQLDNERLELVLRNNCLLCHSNFDVQNPETYFSLDPEAAGSPAYMNLQSLLTDAHFRHNLSCSGCHGGDQTEYMDHSHPEMWPEDRDERLEDPSWIPEFCGRCHADPVFMGRFNPGMATDQLAKYRVSHHGRALLEEGNPKAAHCTSCHGIHGIQSARSPASKVAPKNVPGTCAACHADAEWMKDARLADGRPMPTDQYEQYKDSVHGKALLEHGDIGAPACNDCHGNHAAVPAEVASVAQICRTCHARNGTLFDGSSHKEAFEEHQWPECEHCHGNHGIEKTSDEMLAVTPGALCAGCHDEHAKDHPECRETAGHFHETILELAAAGEEFAEVSVELAERGLDVEGIDEERRNLHDILTQSRSSIHSFNRSDFDSVADPGFESITKIEGLVEIAEADFQSRRGGLVIAIALLLLVVLSLWLKIRELERGPDE